MADAAHTRRILVAISGASGAVYGARLLQVLQGQSGIETHLVVSDAGWRNLQHELDMNRPAVEARAHRVHDVANVGAAIASGKPRMEAAACASASVACPRSATQAGSPLAPPPDNPALARNCSGCLKGSSMAEACSCKFSAFHTAVPPGRLASTQSTVASCTPRRASRTCQGDSCTPAVGGVLTLASSTG